MCPHISTWIHPPWRWAVSAKRRFVYSPPIFRSGSTAYASAREECAGYCRLSKSNEEGHSLAAQRDAIEQHCARNHLTLLRIEEDDGRSGRSTKQRPGFHAALEACRSGAADGLLAARLDRVTRSLLDFARLVQDAEKHGYAQIVIDQNFDLSTPGGKAMAGMLAVFGQYERDLISARTRTALAHVKAHGSKSGRPIGNPGFARVSPHVAGEIRKLHAEGLSYRGIALSLNARQVPTAQGGKCWHGTSVANIVNRQAVTA